ncbi:response regulator [Amycolatopsis bartoniae]|nr:response regulator [Amycolatopsis bartoniae]
MPRSTPTRPLDVVILDVMLPDIDGIQVCRPLGRTREPPLNARFAAFRNYPFHSPLGGQGRRPSVP